MIYIDIGAYDGDTLAKGISKFPDCTAYFGFEPDPDNFAKLKERFGDNPKVIIYSIAIGTNPKLYKGATPESHSGYASKFNVSSKFILVETLDIIAFLKDYPDEDITLKINAEGAEYPILEKMIETGWIHHVKRLYIQWHVEKIGEISMERHNHLIAQLKEIKIPIRSVRSL